MLSLMGAGWTEMVVTIIGKQVTTIAIENPVSQLEAKLRKLLERQIDRTITIQNSMIVMIGVDGLMRMAVAKTPGQKSSLEAAKHP